MYKPKPNEDLRLMARRYGVAAWQVAQQLDISASTYFYWLRKDLDTATQEKIKGAIEKAGTEGNED